ncbi:MAG: hypothetical protein ABFD59_07100, partial [Smithella sp.]
KVDLFHSFLPRHLIPHAARKCAGNDSPLPYQKTAGIATKESFVTGFCVFLFVKNCDRGKSLFGTSAKPFFIKTVFGGSF